jgi:hypothetical protein
MHSCAIYPATAAPRTVSVVHASYIAHLPTWESLHKSGNCFISITVLCICKIVLLLLLYQCQFWLKDFTDAKWDEWISEHLKPCSGIISKLAWSIIITIYPFLCFCCVSWIGLCHSVTIHNMTKPASSDLQSTYFICPVLLVTSCQLLYNMDCGQLWATCTVCHRQVLMWSQSSVNYNTLSFCMTYTLNTNPTKKVKNSDDKKTGLTLVLFNNKALFHLSGCVNSPNRWRKSCISPRSVITWHDWCVVSYQCS